MNWEAVAKEAMKNYVILDAFDELSLEDKDSVIDRVRSSVANSCELIEKLRIGNDDSHVAGLNRNLQKFEHVLRELEERREGRIE